MPYLANALGVTFSDVSEEHENKSAIEYLRNEGIVQGYENGQFKPDYTINRAEFIKIVAGSLESFSQQKLDDCVKDKDLKNWTSMYFEDIPMDAWFASYICVAKELGIVDGYPDGTFKPAQDVNFVEASKIVANAQGLKTAEQSGDEDWYIRYVKSLETESAIPESIRSFGKRITRGEMAEVVFRVKEDPKKESLSLTKLTDRNSRENELPQIDSCNALIEKLELDRDQERYYEMEEDMAIPLASPSPTTTRSESKSMTQNEAVADTSGASAGSDDFSQTNLQVKGVDEADIIKNDGKYIYMIRGKTVKIIDAFPAGQMKEIATIELDDDDFNPSEIYIDKDQMVIIGSVYRSRTMPVEPFNPIGGPATSRMIAPQSFGSSRMKTYLYDISNRSNPKRQRAIEMEGNYQSSRKVGKNVYFVLNQYIPYYRIQDDQPADIIIPQFKDSAHGNEDMPMTRCTGIQYFPRFSERNYLIVAGLDISDLDGDLNRRVILGNSQNIYASRENLYVAAPHYFKGERTVGRDIVIEETNGTLIYRFSLNDDEIEYQNQGFVPGNILNQFSMDEYDDHFRIATTQGNFWSNGQDKSFSNMFVLDNQTMNIKGKVTEIAPGERIYSVRFMGAKAYMVTFKKVDPLFVFDVSDHTNPKILGKLKIPGYSDYIHPYDENHIIGFGKDAVEASNDMQESRNLDFAWYQGMKIALFDVSDVENPKEKFVEMIGDRGTESEVLHNHKALLFDKEKNLLAFPVTVHEIKDKENAAPNSYGEPVFQGAYVYSIDKDTGFELRGKVTHMEDDSAFENGNIWQYSGRMIQRLLYIGEYLYSISPDYVRSYDLKTTDSKKFIKLSGEQKEDVNYIDEVIF